MFFIKPVLIGPFAKCLLRFWIPFYVVVVREVGPALKASHRKSVLVIMGLTKYILLCVLYSSCNMLEWFRRTLNHF